MIAAGRPWSWPWPWLHTAARQSGPVRPVRPSGSQVTPTLWRGRYSLADHLTALQPLALRRRLHCIASHRGESPGPRKGVSWKINGRLLGEVRSTKYMPCVPCPPPSLAASSRHTPARPSTLDTTYRLRRTATGTPGLRCRLGARQVSGRGRDSQSARVQKV